MPYVPVRVSVEGILALRHRLRAAGDRARDMSPALERVADSFEAHMAAVFASGGAATASGFPPLSDAYSRWKARHYPGMPVLTREGDLGESFSNPTHPDHVREITANQLVIGSRLRTRGGRHVLGKLHQHGTDEMPRRRIVNLPQWLKLRWVALFREYFRQVEKGS